MKAAIVRPDGTVEMTVNPEQLKLIGDALGHFVTETDSKMEEITLGALLKEIHHVEAIVTGFRRAGR